MSPGIDVMRKKGFTLGEVIIVVLVLVVLGGLGLPTLRGIIIKFQMEEIYSTVNTIEAAERVFHLNTGNYTLLPYSITQAQVDDFMETLGTEIPGLNSRFVYGVYGTAPTEIRVQARDHLGWGNICVKRISGNRAWVVNSAHPWAIYFVEP